MALAAGPDDSGKQNTNKARQKGKTLGPLQGFLSLTMLMIDQSLAEQPLSNMALMVGPDDAGNSALTQNSLAELSADLKLHFTTLMGQKLEPLQDNLPQSLIW